MHREEHGVPIIPDAKNPHELKFPNGKEVILQGKRYVFPPLTARGTLKAQEITQKAALELIPLVPKLKNLKDRAETDVASMTPEAMAEIVKEIDEASALLPKVQNQELITALAVGHICISMNYPEITADDYADLVTAEEAKDLFAWAMFGDQAAKKA